MTRRREGLLATSWFGLVTAAIVGPWWLQTGYVWLLDSVWGPHTRLDIAQPGSGYLWQLIIAALSWAVTPAGAEKIILTAVLWSIGLGGYYLARRFMSPAWALTAGLLYLLNPFVYERLLAGQWIVLAGYAFLPVAARVLADVLQGRGRRAGRLAAVIAVYPLVSLHLAYIALGLMAFITLIYICLERPAWLRTRLTLWWLAGTAVATVLINSFWLFTANSSQIFHTFTAGDFANFRTAADPLVGAWGNVLALYGFWRGPAMVEPKTLLSGWWIISLIILVLAIVGAVLAVRERRGVLAGLALAVIPAAALAVGYASPLTRPLVDALMVLPGFRGLRETGKVVAVLALAYAILAPLGVRWLATRLHHQPWAGPVGLACLGLLAAMSVTGLWGGYGQQVVVAGYPAGWYAVRERLARTPDATAVVLPWHGYLNLNFARAYVAQPAPVFFMSPVLVAKDMDNPSYSEAPSPLDEAVLGLTTGAVSLSDWAPRLRDHHGATHVILEKTDDWQSYAERLELAGLVREYDDTDIALFRIPRH